MITHARRILAVTKLLPLLLLIMLPAVVQAQLGEYDTDEGEVDYEINNDQVTIDRYLGSDFMLIIPSTINGYPVTDIGANAFNEISNGSYSLTNVTIPDSVTYISYKAFYGCTSLTSVTMGTNITTIGSYAFDGCSLTSATIPNSVTYIGQAALAYCPLTKVIIPNSVTSIDQYAFAFCSSLTNVTIGTGISNGLVSYAFAYCSSLTGVYFKGNSPTPTNDLTVFANDSKGIVYYQPNTTGWGTNFDGLPTMLNPNTNAVGGVAQIVGNVTVTHADGTTEALQVGSPLNMGDIIQTSAGSEVSITFSDNTTFAVSENARMSVDQFIYHTADHSGTSLFSLLNGAFCFVDGLIGKDNPPGSVNVEAPVGVIGIRGTQFISQQDPCSSTQMVYLIQGELAITPLNTPGVTNICDAPVTISITASSVTTNTLNQAMYNSISNQVFQNTGIVTFPSWLEQFFGCTNNPDAAPTADPSGDGQDNYTKFLAGMNPTNKASYFHILSATPQGNNELVSWMCGGGRTNVLQTTTNFGGTWSNVSPNIILAGSGDSVTNYLHVGAVTNAPTRYYRVRLLP